MLHTWILEQFIRYPKAQHRLFFRQSITRLPQDRNFHGLMQSLLDHKANQQHFSAYEMMWIEYTQKHGVTPDVLFDMPDEFTVLGGCSAWLVFVLAVYVLVVRRPAVAHSDICRDFEASFGEHFPNTANIVSVGMLLLARDYPETWVLGTDAVGMPTILFYQPRLQVQL